MSSPQEDKSDTMETPTPAGPPAIVSVSGPLAAPGEATWAPARADDNNVGLYVRYAGRSAVGLVREHNEDNFVIANLTEGESREARPAEVSLVDAVGDGGLLFAVCDGMGGAAAGEVASQMAVDVLQESMRRGGAPGERDVLARRLVSAVEEAGRRIFDSAQKERSRRGMGTTATAAVLVDKVLFLAEVGDSRAYLLRGGVLKQLTKDQSLVNQLIEAGHLTEAEAEAFEHSNIILQALGTSETVQVDLTFVELRSGDRVMICSDGLSGLVTTDTLRDALGGIDDPSECTAALVKCAEHGGGHDNITVIVIDFHGDDLELPTENDTFGYLQYPLVPSSSIAGAFSEEEITEAAHAGSRHSLHSLPARDRESATGLQGPTVDSNPWLWVSAGLTALLVGAWLLAASGSSGNALVEDDGTAQEQPDRGRGPLAPAAPEGPAPDAIAPNVEPSGANGPAAPENAEALAQKSVPVRVYSDVQDAVLLVNGQAHGHLSGTQEAQAMELAPGEYRFEAQRHGNVAATSTVTVHEQGEPGAPLDVYLRLPTGTNEPVPGQSQAKPSAPAAAQHAAPADDVPAQVAQPQKAAPVAAAPQVNKPSAPTAPAVEAKPRASAVAAAPTPARRAKAAETSPAKPESRAANAEHGAPAPAPEPKPAAPAPPPDVPVKPASPIPDNPF